MSMFKFHDDMMKTMSDPTFFASMFYSPDAMQKAASDWMQNNPFATMTPQSGSMPSLFSMNGEMPQIPTLPDFMVTQPAGTAAAGSALAMGIASHMMGLMFGAATGAMSAATHLSKAELETPGMPKSLPNPFAFEWARGASDAMETAAMTMQDVVEESTVLMQETVQASTAAVQDVIEESGAAVAAPKAATQQPQTQKKAPKKAPARKTTKAAPAATPAAATKSAPASGTKATVKTAETAKSATNSNAQADRKPAEATQSDTLQPEDYTKPKAVSKPAEPDDLKLITGVGPKLEQVLNKIGIWTYGQIAAWTPSEVAWVDDYLQFKGRIDRDDWLAQADALASGGREEYLKRFGKAPR